jgi:nucleotide-binding universal stress UspA family protein
MYKKLLVAVDGSDISLHAFKEALGISKKDVLVLAVAPPYSGDLRVMGTSDLSELLKEPCERALDKALQMAEDEGADVRPVCIMGEAYETIVDVAEDEGRDLIVMGVKGAGFPHGLLMGSTTARVIGFSGQDVLVIPEKASVRWERILLATDGSEYSRRATERAVVLAQDSGGTLKIVSVLEISSHIYAVAPEIAEQKIKLPKQYAQEAKDLAASRGIIAEDFVREAESADEVIIDLARKANIDLIVMGSHGRTGLKRLLMGSVTERVIGNAPCPVLVVKI